MQSMRSVASTHRAPIVLAHLAGALQGFAMVSLPASATVLHELGLGDAAYGSSFVAQTIAATTGALASGAIARRTRVDAPLAALLAFALACHAVALVALAAATWIDPFVAAMTAGSALGLGFGVGAVPLNAVPAAQGGKHGAAATTAMHGVIGAGFALGPLVIGAAIAAEAWASAPLVLAIATLFVAAAIVRVPLPAVPQAASSSALPTTPRARLVVLGAVAICYALAEGTFSSWATVFLHDARGVDASTAASALGAFWAALALGRLLSTPLLRRMPALRAWRTALFAMALVMLALPLVGGATSGVVAFALAGLATAPVFPLTVALATGVLGLRSELASSLLTAALMIGVGVGSFAIGALREALGFDALYRIGAAYPLLALALGSWLFTGRHPSSRSSQS